jgi:hypothetical protein
MSRLSTLYNSGRNMGAGLCVAFIILIQHNGPGLLWVPFPAVFALTLCQLALLAAARRPVARLLASPSAGPS